MNCYSKGDGNDENDRSCLCEPAELIEPVVEIQRDNAATTQRKYRDGGAREQAFYGLPHDRFFIIPVKPLDGIALHLRDCG
ncbi:hypothetical protein D3C74_435170 [compost metagenome]